MAKFTPLHDRILVRRVEEAETTRGGIIIPDSAKEKPQQAMVEAVGSGKILEVIIDDNARWCRLVLIDG